jgi:hypothetical protein
MKRIPLLLCALMLSLPFHAEAIPKDAVGLDSADWPENWRMHAALSSPEGGILRWPDGFTLPLKGAVHDVALERPEGSAPVLRVWTDGKLVRGPEEAPALASARAEDFPKAKVDLGGDFTAYARFSTAAAGTLFSKCAPKEEWSPDAKALFIRGGRLVYDIGWLGALSGGPRVNDGAAHTVMLIVQGGTAVLWLDGKQIAKKGGHTRPDATGHILKTGRAAPDFGGAFDGRIEDVRIWQRALGAAETASIFKDGPKGANTPDFEWTPKVTGGHPVLTPAAGAQISDAWVQPLERADHSAIVGGWNNKTLAEGRTIYTQLCIVCHGTKEQPGSLPTALRFTEGAFKNGSDPHSLYLTLTKGFGQMVPQPQYTTQQKYAVIQYIRETFLRPHNPSQLTELTPAYLDTLPKGLTRAEAEKEDRSPPPYVQMELGPVLFWTLQVAENNIAQKGIAVRLDDGPGGVTKGRAWMIYDHDTMRLAAATTGQFVDWRGIAFDGSHGTHTSLTGERHVINPNAAGWAGPDGSWDAPRTKGRDGKLYGPVPRGWAHYEGLYLHGGKAVIAQTVHGVRVLESPGWQDYGPTPVFFRTLNVSASATPLLLRVAPDSVQVTLTGDGTLKKQGGFWLAELPGNARTRLASSRATRETIAALEKSYTAALDLEPLTHGGPPRWPEDIVTSIAPRLDSGPFAADALTLPESNPWKAWLRPGGFDFTPDGQGAVVAMWNGDVWKVDGLTAHPPDALHWHRIAAGLFQPLGVKYRGNDLFVTCRDQIACLKDLNGDGETDFIANFNNDHQVTEHFHEFAMGLQTDSAGNFYYAKSARHALPAVVPHHGTLLRVSADGSHTDILASGFRAANGVCLNDDGSFFVTDQEGHWTPKNRINRVKPGGFYGNLFGYTDVTDPSDSAMQPPMVWITNEKDRSPAELLWVPKGVWGSLSGTLLNLSYGTGRVFAVPSEEAGGVWQGAVCELPLPAFADGVMRGRFGTDGNLYTCGMFAWAGNATAPGGFHRIRRTGQAACVPVAVHARPDTLEVVLSDALDPASLKPETCSYKVWGLKRSANYGSPHIDERRLPVSSVASHDGKTITLTIPGLACTQCYELVLFGRDASGAAVERNLHGTILRMK